MKRLVAAACCVFALGACSFPTADDIQTRDGAFWLDASQYNAVDDAVRAEMEAKFGAENVFFSNYPEEEFHRWVFEGPVKVVGLDKYRLRVEAYPKKERDGFYVPLVIARKEVYTGDSMDNRRGAHIQFGSTGYTEIGRDEVLEAELENAMNARLRQEGNGRSDFDDAEPMAESGAGGR